MKNKIIFKDLLRSGAILALVAVGGCTVSATTPNPGHPWTDVGDGTFMVSGPTVLRTYTFPDADATVLTTNATVTVPQGGTGRTSIAQGDILYASAADTLSVLAKNTTATRYLTNSGTSNNPAWAQVDLTNGVTGILPPANGGTNNAYLSFTGPTTSVKTFTLPNASATILTSDTPLTVAQGGTGSNYSQSNIGGVYESIITFLTPVFGTATAGQIFRSSAVLPGFSTAVYPSTAGSAGQVLISDGTNFINSTPTYPDTAGTAGNILTSDGTNFVSTAIPDQVQFAHFGQYDANTGTFTSVASGTTTFQFIGVAPKAYTSCKVLQNQTQNLSGVTWAEIAIFKGPVVANANASLSLLGYTSIAAYTSSGRRVTTVTLSGSAAGDQLWVAWGSLATGVYQARAALADDIQSGVVQTAAQRPSTASVPFTTTLAATNAVPAALAVTCS